MRLRSYLALSLVATLLLGWRISSVLNVKSPSITPISPVSAQGAPNCSIIGNNMAVPFGGNSVGKFDEALFTLALLHTGSDAEKQAVIDAINSTDKTVIVRLGAGKAAGGPPADQYAAILNSIGAAVAPKTFIATAGHNEPNCAEYIPLDQEVKYVTTVTRAKTASNLTLITGQIDFYCGDANLPKPQLYIDALTKIPGIQGLALPFYITEGTPNAASTVALFNAVAATSSLPIYVTESGPLKPGTMREFVTGVAKVLENTKIQAFLLFNAPGLNPDPNFAYTLPFANLNCREAFRTQCQDIEAVIEACGESDPNKYYLYPINGLATKDQPTIFNDLVDQGYEAQCSTPAFYIEAQEGGQIARLKDLIAAGQEQVRQSELEGTFEVNYVTATVPIWRDSNPVASLMNSLEDFWGHQDISTIPTGKEALTSAPIYSLLNTEQQCTAKVKILENIDTLCQKLADPKTCALYQPIQGATSYTTETLLPAWRTSGLKCTQVAQGQITTAQQPIVDAVMKTPLYLDKAYRLAFVVMATELRNDPNPLSYFNFMRKTSSPNIPKHEIRVVAFKIPDIGTNRILDKNSYQDPLQLTRDTFLDSRTIDKNTADAQQERQDLKVAPGPEALPVLECGSENCNDPLVKSLVQMINNQQAQCTQGPEAFEYEPSDTIKSSGTLTSNPGTEFADGSDPAQDLFTSPADQIENPQKATFNFLARIGLGGTGESNVQTQVFLIYPMGFELEKFEETLLAFFDREWGNTYTDRKQAKDFFKLGGIDQEVTGGKATYGFFDPLQPCIEDPSTGAIICNSTAEAQIGATTTNKEPRILGGRLGFLTRSIQKTLYGATDPVLDFLKSCRTTEQFLTGNCKGANNSSGSGSSSGAGNGTCETVPTGPCSVENLTRFFTDSPGIPAAVKAEKASRICNRESGGSPQAKNISCLKGGTDYSIGLFQVNMLAHCARAFEPWTFDSAMCTIKDPQMVATCTENLLDPEKNIQEMIRISSNGTNWNPWSAAKVCGIE